MMHLGFAVPVQTIVCLAAHPDDIEIGCAGTLLKLADELTAAHFIVASGSDIRTAEAEESAKNLLGAQCTVNVVVGPSDDGYLPYQEKDVKSFVRDTVRGLSPDLVFAPSRDDLHQDHRFVAELALQVFRDDLILEYEIPKYDGDLTTTNLYVPLSRETLEAKVDHLMAAFESQHHKPWYRPEVFRSLATIRGVESHAPDGYAEGFHARKVVFG